MISRFTALLALVAFTIAFANSATGQEPKKLPPKNDEPSIHGTWVGSMTLAGQKYQLESTFRADGTYKTIVELNNIVVAEKGTFEYEDQLLTVKSEGSSSSYTVTFEDKNTMRLKGKGFVISYKKRQ